MGEVMPRCRAEAATVREVTNLIMTHLDRLDPDDANRLCQTQDETSDWTGSSSMFEGGPA